MAFVSARRHEPKRATRHAAFALAILALHGAMGYLLLTPAVWRVWSPQPATEEITWLVLATPKIEQPKAAVSRPLKPSARVLTRSSAPSNAVLIQPPLATTPLPDQGLTALRSYVWCGALDDGKLWTGDQRNCDKVQWGLHTAALPKREPTEREKDLARKFEHDLAFDKSPKLIPCVNGGINIICLAQGVMSGFDFKMASYADSKPANTKCASRFDGEHCARIYSMGSTAPTAVHR